MLSLIARENTMLHTQRSERSNSQRCRYGWSGPDGLSPSPGTMGMLPAVSRIFWQIIPHSAGLSHYVRAAPHRSCFQEKRPTPHGPKPPRFASLRFSNACACCPIALRAIIPVPPVLAPHFSFLVRRSGLGCGPTRLRGALRACLNTTRFPLACNKG